MIGEATRQVETRRNKEREQRKGNKRGEDAKRTHREGRRGEVTIVRCKESRREWGAETCIRGEEIKGNTKRRKEKEKRGGDEVIGQIRRGEETKLNKRTESRKGNEMRREETGEESVPSPSQTASCTPSSGSLCV